MDSLLDLKHDCNNGVETWTTVKDDWKDNSLEVEKETLKMIAKDSFPNLSGLQISGK